MRNVVPLPFLYRIDFYQFSVVRLLKTTLTFITSNVAKS